MWKQSMRILEFLFQPGLKKWQGLYGFSARRSSFIFVNNIYIINITYVNIININIIIIIIIIIITFS